jgi:predicted metal-binding membrane protein
MTTGRAGRGAAPAATAAALAGTLGLAGACWVVAVWQLTGMDMGTETRLGSFAAFIGVWLAMMAAMMLPGAAPGRCEPSPVTGPGPG